MEANGVIDRRFLTCCLPHGAPSAHASSDAFISPRTLLTRLSLRRGRAGEHVARDVIKRDITGPNQSGSQIDLTTVNGRLLRGTAMLASAASDKLVAGGGALGDRTRSPQS